MRERLIYILKHSALLQQLYRIIMSFVFQICGMFVKTDDYIIVFVSFMGKSFNDSPKVIYDYISNQEKYKDYKCIWAFEKPEKYPELNTVKIDTIRYFLTVLKAKYWVTNTNIERGLKFKKRDQIYLNTWHGVALKHIGNDCPGRKDFNFNTVDYLVVSGNYDEKVFKSAFNAKENSYLKCGMPRNEELWNVNPEIIHEKKKLLNLPEGKKIILYAPTWRDSTDGGKSYSIKPPINFNKWEETLGDDYVVLFRAHHQTTKVLGIYYNDFVRDYSDYPYVNDLMIASDILITDYSAIAFDFSILNKAILIYAYDYDTYLKDRGTYFDLDDIYPNKSCRTEEELLEKINSLDLYIEKQKTMSFREKFIQYGTKSTETCVKAIFGEKA